MHILDELQWRGSINQITDDDGLRDLLDHKSIGVYCGIDPTGDSMHIGHLIPFMILKRFQIAGCKPVIVLGGVTGSIGDPSGKKAERKLQSLDQIEHNKESLKKQLNKLFGKDNFTIVNNYDWLAPLSMIDFLRDYGKLFNVNTMINKEIVASRLEAGISFTEFTYQILQSIDFLHLYQNEDVQLQIGGADQWGNITAGLDLIRRVEGSEAKAYGLTVPLLLKSDGTKFGKSEGGNIWLNPDLTTPYEFYQFWINQEDNDVIKLLKYFTFLDQDEINELQNKVEKEPWKREAQKKLAEEVTRFVHGDEALKQAQKITKALFSGNVQDLTAEEIETGFKEFPSVDVSGNKQNIIDFLINSGIEKSRRQAREDVSNGAISINGVKEKDIEYVINPYDKFDGKFVIVRRGRKKYFLARVNNK